MATQLKDMTFAGPVMTGVTNESGATSWSIGSNDRIIAGGEELIYKDSGSWFFDGTASVASSANSASSAEEAEHTNTLGNGLSDVVIHLDGTRYILGATDGNVPSGVYLMYLTPETPEE